MDKNEIIKKLEALASSEPSIWREIAEWRVKNHNWLRVSGMIAVKLFEKHGLYNAKDVVSEILKCDDKHANDIIKGQADLTLSEIDKLIGFDEFENLLKRMRKMHKKCKK